MSRTRASLSPLAGVDIRSRLSGRCAHVKRSASFLVETWRDKGVDWFRLPVARTKSDSTCRRKSANFSTHKRVSVQIVIPESSATCFVAFYYSAKQRVPPLVTDLQSNLYCWVLRASRRAERRSKLEKKKGNAILACVENVAARLKYFQEHSLLLTLSLLYFLGR